MEYAQDDYLMISGIQHFKFCRRQWALIHIEQQWAENVHTVVGELMHKKAHDPEPLPGLWQLQYRFPKSFWPFPDRYIKSDVEGGAVLLF